MELATIFEEYRPQLLEDSRFRNAEASKTQLRALNDVISCRTAGRGEIQVHCTDCGTESWFAHSCGHRFCPKCQHHESSRWLQRQVNKLLPVNYFLVTFTLPAELRAIAKTFSKKVFDLMFEAASKTLFATAQRKKYLGGHIGFTGVLHTHSRKLDFHPHLHFVVPGLGLNRKTGTCTQTKDRFLIPEAVLGALFKHKLLAGLKASGFLLKQKLYQINWIVDCEYSGKGESALKYLSRYLYRGVISEKQLISHEKGKVTFSYVNSKTKQTEKRTLPGLGFTQLLLQHVLPKGFRRVRDFGFLHGNAGKTLTRIQMVFIPKFKARSPVKRPAFRCPVCGKPTHIRAVAVFRCFDQRLKRSPPG